MQTADMIRTLRAERIETWFDLGLFLDRFREERKSPDAPASRDFAAFKRDRCSTPGFVTFYFGVDGVTMEIAKYAAALRRIVPDAEVHYIGGRFDAEAGTVLGASAHQHTIDGCDGFDAWKLYASFFEERLERGGPRYNALIRDFWNDTLEITERLGSTAEEAGIGLLFSINANSNPGNVALALALVFVSEFLGIPVISNNHDFYWEAGHSAAEREARGLPPGPRDHFFANAHLGEFFTIIQMIYPWESRSWMSMNINRSQSSELVERFGHNPANVREIGTAIDTAHYTRKRRRVEALDQVAAILGGYEPQLRSVSASEMLESDSPPSAPTLISARSRSDLDFSSDNMVFLQPTRIISRKNIGVDFQMISRLFDEAEFAQTFRANPSLKLTLLVTGPVATGHSAYLKHLLRRFESLVSELDEEFRDRVHFGLLFSEFDRPEFRRRFERPLDMVDLYNIASIVTLPSETEGRGLPIIESAACGVPIVARRYHPTSVFVEVIGEMLARDQRLEVIDFTGPWADPQTIGKIKDYVLYPQDYNDVGAHNRRVIEARYSLEKLSESLEAALHAVFLQLQPNGESLEHAARALSVHREFLDSSPDELAQIVNTDNREYLPGYGRMGFMLMLKSLIDPSYFRVEEQRLRGMAFSIAQRLVTQYPGPTPLLLERLHDFYNRVESLFLHRQGEMTVMMDHSFAYRHRNRRYYPYRDLTPQELTGVINRLFNDLASPPATVSVTPQAPHHFSDWNLMVSQLCRSNEISLDDRERLFRRLRENVPIAFFPGKAIKHELDFFVVQTVRERLGLGAKDELTVEHLTREPSPAPIYILKHAEPRGDSVTASTLEAYVARTGNEELKLLFREGICRVVATDQLSVGIDFRQLGSAAITVLAQVRDSGGFLVATNAHAATTTDVASLERFHLGRVSDELTANIMGIPVASGYVQWVPAGLRATLAYPTPVQTALDLSRTLESPQFREACERHGEAGVLDALRADAETRGSPVRAVLDRLTASNDSQDELVEHNAINGLYGDGLPWSGVIARMRAGGKPLRVRTVMAESGTRTVIDFVRDFNERSGETVKIAFNGGYILNAELVGKLGLPERYIGSPLGLVISQGKVICPPLFNKPALLVAPDGSLSIRRVNCAAGLALTASATTVEISGDGYNPTHPTDRPCFYDLLYENEDLPADGRTLVRLAGNRIMDVVHTSPGERVPVLPVGITLSFAPGMLPDGWSKGTELEVRMLDWPPLGDAVEAGPMLLVDGEVCIDMEHEGWKTGNSIRTQAARLDYLDMRGPKIAVGLDAEGQLTVLTVNGRIRESVGATHGDMAGILRQQGVVTAMGFDPGGSSTLVVGTQNLNISPYNHDYERNVYALPPEPRAVSNVVIAY